MKQRRWIPRDLATCDLAIDTGVVVRRPRQITGMPASPQRAAMISGDCDLRLANQRLVNFPRIHLGRSFFAAPELLIEETTVIQILPIHDSRVAT